MKLSTFFESTIKADLPKNILLKKSTPIAQLTFEEWYSIINKNNIMHNSDAYNWSLEVLNRHKTSNDDYGKKMFTKKLNNRYIMFYGKHTLRQYSKRKKDGNYETDKDGNILLYSNDEIIKKELNQYEYTFTAIDQESNMIVGTAQDEWGALLIVVAKEYRNFGIGKILGNLMRDYVPYYSTGGVTELGKQNLFNVYSEYVKKASSNGSYTKWIKDGIITIEKAKLILKSAKIKKPILNVKPTLFVNDPKDWLWANIGDSIVVYNKMLYEQIKSNFDDYKHLHEYWAEYMFDQYLIGMIYIGPDATNTDLNVWQFGGKTEKLKHALMESALALIAKEYNDMYNVRILNEISKYVNNSNVIMLKSKHKHEILINPEPYNKTNVVNNLKNLFDKEIKIRKQYDKYDEIITIILEQATSKFDDYV